jgi:ketosteroid isomerase-like protein
MTATDTTTEARETARRFIAAFNARDADVLRELVAPDAELRTVSGEALRGHDGLRALLDMAQERELRLVQFRPATVERRDGDVHVSVPLRELIGPDDIERSAEFEIRDGRIVAFAVRPFE